MHSVEMNRSAIRAASAGAYFVPSFPPSNSATGATDGGPELSPSQRSAYRVLVVDDEVIVREVIAAILRRRGYLADAVDSATAALDHIVQQKYACVLTDVTMPEMNGIELASRLKEEAPALPVILMSGIEIPSKDELTAIGARAALLKPLKWPQLLALIDALCTQEM